MVKKLPKSKFQLKNPLKNWSKKKKIMVSIIAIVAIGTIVLFASFNSKRKEMKENMAASFTTETAKIERQTLTNSISATGTVESAETKTVNTKMTNMEVLSVYVKEGDYVEEGTILCEFDSSDYEESLAAAKNNQSVNEQIEALGDDYTTTYNNAITKAEDGLQDVRDTRDEAKEAYIEAMEELSDEEGDVSSAKNTYEEYVQKHPNAEADLKQAQSNYEAAQVSLNALESARNEYTSAFDALTTANENLAAAESSGKEIDITTFYANVQNAETTLTQAESNLSAYGVTIAEDKETTAANADTAITTAKENCTTAKAAYDEANRIATKMQNYKTAYQQEEAELKAAEQAVEQTEAQYEQAQSQREDYQTQYEEALEKAQDEYDRAVLEEQLISETQEEKTINEYTELIEDCVVKASMSGVITSLNVTEGNNFEGGDIYTIQDNEHFIVSATVDEYDISSIEKGMTAYIKTDATGDAEMTGEVTYVAIAPSNTGGAMGAISSSASYRIEVTIAEADENLRAGMTAKLSIALEESADALTVPYDAVTTAPDGTSTITVDMNGEKKTITVETGLETDYYTEIISDEISEGMTVYLSTPMLSTTPDTDEEMRMPGVMNVMPGGDMPSGERNRGGGDMPSGGGMPAGGGPGGF